MNVTLEGLLKEYCMILTGPEIVRARERGEIIIEPFDPDSVNPNSYNFRLGRRIRAYDTEILDPQESNSFVEWEIPPEGFILEPGRLYLAHTMERLGGTVYAPTFAARSSVARLGVFINLSACLGDVGFVGQWTLQLFTSHRVRVYPGMAIGQMMWWQMKGERLLYEGKYQNSHGVRTSDIHVDFARKRSRALLPRLTQRPPRSETGGKFSALADVAGAYRVPSAFCVPVSLLRDETPGDFSARIAAEMADIRATVGAFLPGSCDRIAAAAAGLSLGTQTRDMLAAAVQELAPGVDAVGPGLLAVRSSGLDEDGTENSLAGVHATFLNVSPEDVPAAVEQVWRSYYAPSAVMARVRRGDFSTETRLAVMVQRMVEPLVAGVAFGQATATGDVAVTADWVEGLADSLLAGTVCGHHMADSGRAHWPILVQEVPGAVRALRGHVGYDVDVEWAVDRTGFHLLQVRPVTAATVPSRQRVVPVLETLDLYEGTPPPGFDLGEVASVYAYYVAKRGPARRLARSFGFPSGGGLVLRFNAAGLVRTGGAPDELDAFLAGSVQTAEYVLDCGDTLRQVICRRDDVRGQLRALASGLPRGTVCTAIVREFIRGTGVITAAAEGGLLAEVAPDGLMALNRGIGAAVQLFLADDETCTAAEGVPEAARSVLLAVHSPLRQFTEAMSKHFGATTSEWVLLGDRLLFLDYSAAGGDALPTAGTTIAPGVASGPVIDLTGAGEVLGRLSEGSAVSIDKSADVLDHEDLAKIVSSVRSLPDRPVVVCAFPYAVLSVLLDDVAGFVFQQGSALCHLAILLRESGVPAVVCQAPVADHLLIADGSVVAL
jgi:deoxycytidine triphosphate deaminase